MHWGAEFEFRRFCQLLKSNQSPIYQEASPAGALEKPSDLTSIQPFKHSEGQQYDYDNPVQNTPKTTNCGSKV